MDFRIDMTLEIDRVTNGVAEPTPVPVQLVYHCGRWHAHGEQPLVSTLAYESMEEAIVAAAKEAAGELQPAASRTHLL
jgi:hypothetical protein